MYIYMYQGISNHPWALPPGEHLAAAFLSLRAPGPRPAWRAHGEAAEARRWEHIRQMKTIGKP